MGHKGGSIIGLIIIGLAGVAIWKLAEEGAFNPIVQPFTSQQREGGLYGGTIIPSQAYHVNVAT